MSTENQKEVQGPQLEYIDIINATKIMEAAIERKAFSIKELAEVAAVVARFQDFSQAILEEQKAKEEAQSSDESVGESE